MDGNTTEAAEENTTKTEEQPNTSDPEHQPDTGHPQSEPGQTDTEPEVIKKDLWWCWCAIIKSSEMV